MSGNDDAAPELGAEHGPDPVADFGGAEPGGDRAAGLGAGAGQAEDEPLHDDLTDAAGALTALHEAVAELRGRSILDPARIGTTSRLPGGEMVHRAGAKVMSRQTRGIMEQTQAFTEQATRIVELLVELAERHAVRVHPDLAERIDAALERVARIDRLALGPEASVADLHRRIERLEAVEAARQFRPWFSNERFEEQFRGSRPDILDRYRDLAARLQECGPVLDIGFGRGEFLQLLGELGVEARGVEIDPFLVEAGRASGLDVSVGAAADTLLAEADGALGGIVLVQVVEHLPAQELLEVVILARDKLRAGGRLIMETVNPGSLYVFAHSFYIDPTHSRPIHPAYLEFLCREAGFAVVETDWRSVPPEDDRLHEVEGLPALSDNIGRLNRLLWSPGDYAVIATR